MGETLPDFTGSILFLARHAEAAVPLANRTLGPGISPKSRHEAIEAAEQLRVYGVNTDSINCSEYTRAIDTAEAQKTDDQSEISKHPELNEVETKLTRNQTACKLFFGIVPKEFQDAGRTLLQAMQDGKIQGYSTSHNGLIAGARKIIQKGEFPDLKVDSATFKKGQFKPEKPRSLFRRSLVMKNLATVAIKPTQEN